MKKMLQISSLLVGLCMAASVMAAPQNTQVMIRALAADSKFIGSGMMQVSVVVEDVETGEILDQGMLEGKTGDTRKIMLTPQIRGAQLADADTGGSLANLKLDVPRLLRFTIKTPYGFRPYASEAIASVTSWVAPGKHILGDGIVINLPGFIINTGFEEVGVGEIKLAMSAAMFCGCQLSRGGLWDGDKYEAKAILLRGEQVIDEFDLTFQNDGGLFLSENIKVPVERTYNAIFYLYNPKTGNTAAEKMEFSVSGARMFNFN